MGFVLAARGAFEDWKNRWPDAKLENYIFPTESLMFQGSGAPEHGVMTAYGVDPSRPPGARKRAGAR